MVQPKDLLKASLEAGRELFRHPSAPDTTPHAEPTPAAHHHALSLVPIRAIGPSERERVARHLLHLEPQDRYLRFIVRRRRYVARQCNQFVDQYYRIW